MLERKQNMETSLVKRERVMLPERLREAFQHHLAVCVSAARSFDGTEVGEDRVLDILKRFEEWQFATFAQYFHEQGQPRLSLAAEREVVDFYYQSEKTQVLDIPGLMEFTTRLFTERLQAKKKELLAKVRVQYLDGVLVPPGDAQLVPSDGVSEEPFTKEAVFSPRLIVLLGALQERKVFLEDVVVWVGEVPKRALVRKAPYVLLEIPRLGGRQLLVCDQVNEAAFVIVEAIDKEELLHCDKASLKQRYPDRVVKVSWQGEQVWKDELMHALFLEMQPGEKVDIALRESIRKEIQEKFPPETWLHPDGSFQAFMIGERFQRNFHIQGKKMMALCSMFGVPTDEASAYSNGIRYRFLKEVFPGDPYFAQIWERLDEEQFVRKLLGEDVQAWAGFIRGDEVQISQQDGTKKSYRAEQPIGTAAELHAQSWDVLASRRFAGVSLESLTALLLKDLKNTRTDIFKSRQVNAAARLYLEQILFPQGASLKGEIEQEQKDAELRKALGKDVARWRSYFRGEAIQTDKGTVQREQVLLDPDQVFALSLADRKAYFTVAGQGFAAVAVIFAQEEPLLQKQSTISSTTYLYALFVRTVYGTTPKLEAFIHSEQCHAAAVAIMGTDCEKWRRFLQGEELRLRIAGKEEIYRSEWIFPDLMKLREMRASERDEVTIAGIPLSSVVFARKLGITMSEFHKWDAAKNAQDLDEVLLRLLGDQPIKGGTLKEQVAHGRMEELVRETLGASIPKWKNFIMGETKIEVTYEGRAQSFSPEKIYPTKEQFAGMNARARHEARFAGLGISALTTRLRGKISQNPYTEEAVKELANVLFDKEE